MRQNHQHGWGSAFVEGLQRHGWEAELAPAYRPADLVAFWGVRQRESIAEQRRVGEVCILERGYIGDRLAWTSVSFGGGLNGRATFRGVSSDPGRFERHFAGLMRPWRAARGYTLLIGQVPGDMSLVSVKGSLAAWYRDTAMGLRRLGHDVRFRPHPMAVGARRGDRGPDDVPVLGGTLEDALAGAALVVTFNSNTAVDAVLAGAPAVANDIGSMAWPVTTHRIDEAPIRPDRTEWAARLSWCQWSLAEMRSGECWAAVHEMQEV